MLHIYTYTLQDQVEEKDAQLEVEDVGPVDKDILYEEFRLPDMRRNIFSKIVMMIQSERLKKAREEVTPARAEQA